MKYCPTCGKEVQSESQTTCSNCGASLTGGPGYQSQSYTSMPPMKWFKFLIYFLLFAGAVVNLAYGINFLTGNIYSILSDGEVEGDLVYLFYDGLRDWDVAYGILMIAMAGFQIYTRFRLAHYRTNAHILVCAMYGVGTAIGLIYAIAVTSITGEGFTTSTIVSLLFNVALVVLNYVYFKKRSHLFVN